MAGFFRLLPTLSAAQKAAAVHLGVFPDPSQIRVAAVSPRTSPAPAARDARVHDRRGPRPSRRSSQRRGRGRRPGSARRDAARSTSGDRRRARVAIAARRSDPSALATASGPPVATVVSAKRPARRRRHQCSARDPVPSDRRRAQPTVAGTARRAADRRRDATAAQPTSGAGHRRSVGDRLSGIDRLLAQADELPVPPAPRPRFEKPAERQKAAEAKKWPKPRKRPMPKKVADGRGSRRSIGLAGTNWVQLAGGANGDRMGDEFRRLAAKSAALKKRGGAVTAGKDYFRLLTGPFATRGEAQAFVNQLAKDGVDGFSWTRTPATHQDRETPPK